MDSLVAFIITLRIMTSIGMQPAYSVTASSTMTTVDFDEYGIKYMRFTLSGDSERIFVVDMDEEEYLYIDGSDALDLELMLVDVDSNPNITMESKQDALSNIYYLIHRGNTPSLSYSKTSIDNDIDSVFNGDDLRTRSTFHLTVSLKESISEQIHSESVWIRFNRNIVVRPFRSYSNTIKMRKRRRYGLEITSSDLPVFVEMTPNQNHKRMDLDLYGYTEHDFGSYFFPNSKERNHIENTAESVVIQKEDSYFEDGDFYFFEVFGSTDSAFSDMSYSLRVETNYTPQSLLRTVLLIFVIVIAVSFIIGIALSLLSHFGRSILFWLRIRSTPHRHGATKRQIRNLKVIRFQAESAEHDELESPQCIICLDDYAQNERVRILKCSHHFHAKCSDQWFFLNNKCPLCQQHIGDAQDVHQRDNDTDKGIEVQMIDLDHGTKQNQNQNKNLILSHNRLQSECTETETETDSDSHFDAI